MLLRRYSRGGLAPVLALCACLLLVGGCDLIHKLTGGGEAVPSPVPEALFPLHTALEAGAKDSAKSTVAVVAVVDHSRFVPAAPPADGSAPPASDDTEALRLERLTRQELNNGLIHNKLLDVVQPDETLMQQARNEVIKNNSAALSVETVKALGGKLKVMFIVNAVIEEGGASVSVAGQRVEDGSLVFQDSVRNWSIFATPETAAAE
jgi:hypothetical protein